MSEICPVCGLPKDLCVCETIAKETQKVNIGSVRKKFGKIYTTIEGIDTKEIDIKELTKKLKTKFACGGTAKKGKIEHECWESITVLAEISATDRNTDS